jgi:hypothetical protein
MDCPFSAVDISGSIYRFALWLLRPGLNLVLFSFTRINGEGAVDELPIR